MSKARQLADLGNVYDDGALSNRNLIINGAMQVAQRGTSVTVSSTGSSGFRAVDRFNVFNPIDVIAEQSSDAPKDFTYSCKMTKNTAASTNLTSIGCFRYGVELQDIYHLAYGTSSAKTITLSFYVKSSHTGTYNVLALNHGGSTQRQLTKLYTVNSANTWEYKTLTFEADSGFAGHTDAANSMGISLDFICSPSGAWSGGTVNTSEWQNNVTSNRISTNQANALQSNGDSFAITGVQLEVGDTATPFEHRSYGDELAKCQRYYFRLSDTNNGYTMYGVLAGGGTTPYGSIQGVSLRASPTVTLSGSWTYTYATGGASITAIAHYPSGGGGTATNPVLPIFATLSASVPNTSPIAGMWQQNNDTSAYCEFDAEL